MFTAAILSSSSISPEAECSQKPCFDGIIASCPAVVVAPEARPSWIVEKVRIDPKLNATFFDSHIVSVLFRYGQVALVLDAFVPTLALVRPLKGKIFRPESGVSLLETTTSH